MNRLLNIIVLTAIVVVIRANRKLNYRMNKNQKMVYEEFDRLDKHLKKVLAD